MLISFFASSVDSEGFNPEGYRETLNLKVNDPFRCRPSIALQARVFPSAPAGLFTAVFADILVYTASQS